MKREGKGPLAAALGPFQRFLAAETSGGIVLLACAAIALVWANSAWSGSYFALWEAPISLGIGGWRIEKTLAHWINDGLMAIFFFVVGLEIKREWLVGELASARKAALPIAGAIGGMVAPALIYVAFNLGEGGRLRGWGVPMATDIAFVVGALALAGPRAPIGLKVFLVALAIVDDMGAVLVIALFYTSDISGAALGGAGAVALLLGAANLLGVRKPLVYAALGLALWFLVMKSGVHATVAGVAAAMLIPGRSRLNAKEFLEEGKRILGQFERTGGSASIMTDHDRQASVTALEDLCEGVHTPLARMEHALLPWSTFVVMPIFALANAGVRLGGGSGVEGVTTPVGLGVALGLLLGKPIGITLAAWVAVRTGLGALPRGVSWGHVHAAGWLGGIGFTMSLFIANLAFGEGAELFMAKVAILTGSTVAAIMGFMLLRRAKPEAG